MTPVIVGTKIWLLSFGTHYCFKKIECCHHKFSRTSGTVVSFSIRSIIVKQPLTTMFQTPWQYSTTFTLNFCPWEQVTEKQKAMSAKSSRKRVHLFSAKYQATVNKLRWNWTKGIWRNIGRKVKSQWTLYNRETRNKKGHHSENLTKLFLYKLFSMNTRTLV